MPYASMAVQEATTFPRKEILKRYTYNSKAEDGVMVQVVQRNWSNHAMKDLVLDTEVQKIILRQ